METLRQLAERCSDVEFIRLAGRYALVRLANGRGGEIRLVGRQQLESWLDEDALSQDWEVI